MENAGKDNIPDEAERKGLGTPATRAAIIEKLVTAGFVERKGKSLIPTKAGINLVTVLPEPLTSPMLTAEWEQKLTEIAKGGADPDTFMDGIRTMVQEIVSTYSCISEDGKKLFAPEKEVIGTCPRCGQPVYEGKKNFACSDRSCGFVLWKNDRFWTSRKKELTKKMATDLLKKGRTNVKGMWSEKKQATYDAAVILDDTGGKYINFKLEFPKRRLVSMAENKTLEHLPEVRAAVAALSPEDREVLAAVQTSPFKLTTPEQFKEFATNIDYFVFEPNIHDLNDLGWRYLAQHMDMLLPPELLKAIDPVPFGKYAMQEEQGHFTEHGYISLSGDEWNHERPAEPEKKPSIRERLEQGKKECAEKCKAQPHKEKSAPEL